MESEMGEAGGCVQKLYKSYTKLYKISYKTEHTPVLNETEPVRTTLDSNCTPPDYTVCSFVYYILYVAFV
eukprot:1643279-Pyramimonas_sp.AAC.1